jgi:lipase chaperone LimK
MTVPEALERVREWEREHGQLAKHAWAAINYGRPEELDPRLTPEQAQDGKQRWLDLKQAERNERRQRDLAESERAGADVEQWIDSLRRLDES